LIGGVGPTWHRGGMTDAAADTPEPDAVVVGGGPAGLSAASVLAAAGYRVELFERSAAFGEPVRTSGGSFIAPLRALGVPAYLWQPVTRLRIAAPSHDHTFRFRRAKMCVLDVRGLYQWLAVRAATAGAQLHLRSPITSVLQEDGRVVGVVVRGRGEVRARLVVDATGTAGVVARAAGLRGSAPRTAAGVEVEVFAPGYDQREALLVVGDAVAPGGYGWAFPRGDGRVRLGVGVIRPDSNADIEDLLAHLVERVPALRDSCRGAQPIEQHAGVMPVYAHAAVPAAGAGLLVVGDAAGHGSTLLGEGIRHAIVSGRLAGEVGARALADPGVPNDALLQAYPRRWDALVGREMRIGHVINRRIASYGDAEWDRAVEMVSRMSPRLVLTALAGELTPRFAARLVLRHPRLACGEGRRFVRAALARFGN
jgi:digeranylgeranylglycerophospholipid reductase